MNHRQKSLPPIVRNPAWRLAIQRLDKALEKNPNYNNSDVPVIGNFDFMASEPTLFKPLRLR
jgi:hypothetical protein